MKSKSKTKPIDTRLGDKYPYRPKVGDRVRFRPWSVIGKKGTHSGVPGGFVDSMQHLCGTIATVVNSVGDFVQLEDFTTNGDVHWTYSRQMLEPARITKAEAKRIAAAEAERKAKQDADAKARAMLPLPAKNFLAYLDSKPEAFSCQREHVVATVGAILGLDLAPFVAKR